MIPENVRKVFTDNLWFLSTCGDGPNVVPVGFKCVTDDGKFAVGALLLETTLENIKANGGVAIAAANPLTAEADSGQGHGGTCNGGAALRTLRESGGGNLSRRASRKMRRDCDAGKVNYGKS